MATRQNISSGSPFEPTIGFSRAVRIGNIIAVSGTVATDDNGLPTSPDVYEQAKFCFQRIIKALAAAGAEPSDVIRTRMYVTDIAAQADAVGRAHGEFFRDIRPAATMLEVSRFIGPGFLVEIEADAVIGA